jgi:hypothetical protein
MANQVEDKPTAAYWLSLIGGILALIVGLLLILLGAVVGVFTFGFGFLAIGGIGLWVTVCALVVIYSAKQLNDRPMEHIKWGAIILVFSIIGGWSILDFIGGILALVYQPTVITLRHYVPPPQGYYGPAPQQAAYTNPPVCPQCGTPLPANTRFCPHCGKQQY